MSFDPAPSSPADDKVELLAELVRIAQSLDAQAGVELDETEAIWHTAELTEVVRRALAIMNALEQLDAAEQGDADELLFESGFEPETHVGLRSRTTQAPRLGDVCFACTFELNAALRELGQAADFDSRRAAVETARRKSLRAIHAVSRVAPDYRMVGVQKTLDERSKGELESSLAVRRLYSDLRRSLRRAEDETAEAVLSALRYAASALAALMASPHYRELRVSDATLLRRQHTRLLEWSRAGKPAGPGLQLLEDIFTCASLLRDINRRQDLRTHDTELIQRLLAKPPTDRSAWLTSLDRFTGLDDELDRLTAELRASSSREELLGEVAARLAFLS